jgi:hypothetical protein
VLWNTKCVGGSDSEADYENVDKFIHAFDAARLVPPYEITLSKLLAAKN